MTREEKQKAIDALKISAPIMAVSQEEFNDYIQTLNKIIDWLEQETVSKESYDHEYFLRKDFELKIYKLQRQHDKIRAEIESNMESIIGKYDSSIPKSNMPSYKIERNKVRKECISIIDKYKAGSEVSDADSN